MSVSLPSLRVDAFTVGTAAQIQRVRRTGLTFAPEGGTWRMRQVINKLIREEDLYAAVDAAFSQGWERVKLYFLIGLPTETDEDTLGIVDPGQAVRGHRQALPQGRDRDRLGGRLRAQGPDPVPVVRSEHHRGADPQGQPPARRGPSGPGADHPLARSQSHRRGRDRQPGRPPDGRGHRAGLARPAAPSRSGPSTSTCELWTDALAAHGMSLEDTVYRHRTEDEALPWDHLSAGLHRDFLWQDWRDALADHGLEDCRWTPCYDCGACTGFGIEHVVASAVPPAGGSQGTGQDLSTGGQVPVRFLATAPSGAGSATGAGREPAVVWWEKGKAEVRIRFRFSKARQDPLHQPTGRGPDVGAGACAGPPAPGLHRGILAPAPAQLRSGPPHLRESLAEYLDVVLDAGRPETASVDVDALPAQLTPLLPEGIDVDEAAVGRPTIGSLQQQVTSCSWTMRLAGVTREALAERTGRSAGGIGAFPSVRERKGREERRRPPTVGACSVRC